MSKYLNRLLFLLLFEACNHSLLFLSIKSSFRTLPKNEEQTIYSFVEERTHREHRPFTDSSIKSSPRKIIKPPLSKTSFYKLLLLQVKHILLVFEHVNSQAETRSPKRVLLRNNPKTSENASIKNASPYRHRRKLKTPEKKDARVLNEIRILQKIYANLIPMLPFTFSSRSNE